MSVQAVWMLVMPAHANALGGMLVVDPLTQFVKMALLGLTIFTVLISIDSTFTKHVGEYLALVEPDGVTVATHLTADDAARDAEFWARVDPVDRFLRVFQLSQEAYGIVGKLPPDPAGRPRSVARVLRP